MLDGVLLEEDDVMEVEEGVVREFFSDSTSVWRRAIVIRAAVSSGFGERLDMVGKEETKRVKRYGDRRTLLCALKSR